MVIGGGLVGSALAYELVAAGADVTLVDRHDVGRATDAGAGILSPETNQDPHPDAFAFGRAAANHYESLTRRLAEEGVADTGFAITGSLLVAQRPGDDAVMDEAVRLVGSRSPGLADELGPEEVAQLFPRSVRSDVPSSTRRPAGWTAGSSTPAYVGPLSLGDCGWCRARPPSTRVEGEARSTE